MKCASGVGLYGQARADGKHEFTPTWFTPRAILASVLSRINVLAHPPRATELRAVVKSGLTLGPILRYSRESVS